MLDPAKAQILLDSLDQPEAAIVDTALSEAFPYGWVPNPGPQTVAYWCKAHRILYGGAAGGGKSELSIGWGLQRHRNVILFRQSYSDLDGPRGLAGRFKNVLGGVDGWRGDILAWTAKDGSGKSFEFGSIGKPDFEDSHQGRPTDGMLFDEAAQMSEARVRYALGWNRAADGFEGTCQAIFASNPPRGGDGAWLMVWWQPWLDPAFDGPGGPAAHGEIRWCVWSPNDVLVWLPLEWGERPLVWTGPDTYREATPDEAADIDNPEVYRPLSHTFIPARLSDNPYLRGTGYLANLQAMPEPLRTQLMKGDFLAGREDDDYQVIPTAAVEAAIERGKRIRNPYTEPMCCLGVDVAQGGRDSTALAPLHGVAVAPVIEVKGVDTKDGPAVAALVVRYRRGKALVVVDCTGGWGGDAATQLIQQGIPVFKWVASAGTKERTLDGTLTFGNIRALMWWRFREALLDPTLGVILPDDPVLKAELTTPRYRLKGITIYVEEKDELKKRIGRSTNRADAVLQAWAKRQDGLLAARGQHGWADTGPPGDPMAWHNGETPGRPVDPWANTPGTPWANGAQSTHGNDPFDLL